MESKILRDKHGGAKCIEGREHLARGLFFPSSVFSYNPTLCTCQYLCVHAESRHPHFHADPIQAPIPG
jgi:hypothetical protein